MAGAYGNRTHQEPVSRPLTGFEDRAEHQLLTRSRVLIDKGLRRIYQFRSVGPTGYFTGFVPQIGEKAMGRQAKLRRKGEYWATDAGGEMRNFCPINLSVTRMMSPTRVTLLYMGPLKATT